jgi:hypothetical protein
VAADRGLAAVWFTPLLTDEPTVAALRRATGPTLLAGGTADQFWDGPVARSVTADVVEVDGADHAMFVPGPRRPGRPRQCSRWPCMRASPCGRVAVSGYVSSADSPSSSVIRSLGSPCVSRKNS